MAQELKYSLLSEDLILTCKSPAIPIPDIYLSQLLHHKLTIHQEKVIFINGLTGESMTAWNVRDTACTIARGLQDYGITEGDVVFGYCPNNMVYACSMLATTLIGAVFTGCMHTYPLRDLQFQLNDSDAKIILCSTRTLDVAAEAADTLPIIVLLIVLDDDFRETRRTASGKRIISIEQILSRCNRPNDKQMPIVPLKNPPDQAVAFSIYSSGSTGKPKGVLKTHKGMVSYFVSPEPGLHFIPGRQRDVVPCHMPLAHGTGSIAVLSAMYFGITVVMNDGFSVAQFLSCVERYRINYSYIAPSYIVMIAKSDTVKDYDVSSLRDIITGGAPLAVSVVESFLGQFPYVRLFQCYAMTEVGLMTSVDHECKNCRTTGRPIRGVKIKIIDRETGKALSFNQTGEVYVDGPEKTIGYYKRPEADAENFTADGWVKTGDAAYFDEDGLLYIVDRYKEVIKVDTLQVAPSELESVLLTHDSVAEAAVVGVKDEVHGEVPIAFVVPKDTSAPPSEAELLSFVNDQVAAFKRIKSIAFVESLPKISLGKIDRNLLKRHPGSLSALQ